MSFIQNMTLTSCCHHHQPHNSSVTVVKPILLEMTSRKDLLCHTAYHLGRGMLRFLTSWLRRTFHLEPYLGFRVPSGSIQVIGFFWNTHFTEEKVNSRTFELLKLEFLLYHGFQIHEQHFTISGNDFSPCNLLSTGDII